MGRPGPPPTPTALKLLRGNPGRRPLNPREPTPEPGAPEAPGHLDAEGRAEWTRVVAELLKVGLLTRLDRPALAIYCDAWSQWVAASRKLRTHGPVQLSSDGTPRLSPYFRIAAETMEKVRHNLEAFGMSPAARVSLKTATEPHEVDPLAAHLAKRPQLPRKV